MAEPLKYRGVPYRTRLLELERNIGLREVPGAPTYSEIRTQLTAIRHGRQANTQTRSIVDNLEIMMRDYEAQKSNVGNTTAVEAKNTSTQAPLPKNVEDLIRMAEDVHRTHEQVFPGLYDEDAIQTYRKLTQRIISAIGEGAFLEAARIANLFRENYFELAVASDPPQLPNYDAVNKHRERFGELLRAIKTVGQVETFDQSRNDYGRFKIQVGKDVTLKNLGWAVDEVFGYYATGGIADANDMRLVIDRMTGGAIIARISRVGDGLFEIVMGQPPTFDVGKDELLAHLQSTAQ